MPFVSNSDVDRAAMLAEIGVKDMAELFSDIPAARRFPKLDLPEPLSEMDVLREVESLAAKNVTASTCAWFLGAGAYNHFVPSVVAGPRVARASSSPPIRPTSPRWPRARSRPSSSTSPWPRSFSAWKW